MTEAEQLLTELYADRVHTGEFINELNGYFGLARTDNDTVTFPGDRPISLQAVFDSEGVLVRLVAGPHVFPWLPPSGDSSMIASYPTPRKAGHTRALYRQIAGPFSAFPPDL